MNFKYAMIVMLLAGVTLGGCLSTKSDEGKDSVLGIYNVRQVVADNNKISRTVMWSSKAKQNDYELELRLQGDKKLIPYKAKDYSFKDGKGEYLAVNGDKYVGEFFSGLKEGYGIYSFKEG